MPPNFSRDVFPVVDLIPAEALSKPTSAHPVPVLDMPIADQRKWCAAAVCWMQEGAYPAGGCPTADLRADGRCRRSPAGGRCLLLLPFEHPDWRAARRFRYDSEQHTLRFQPMFRDTRKRTPLALEELEVAARLEDAP